MENRFKYCISYYLTPEKRSLIKEKLKISESTFYRKCYARIGEKQGFEACELRVIAIVLHMDEERLLTPEARIFYNKLAYYVQERG